MRHLLKFIFVYSVKMQKVCVGEKQIINTTGIDKVKTNVIQSIFALVFQTGQFERQIM